MKELKIYKHFCLNLIVLVAISTSVIAQSPEQRLQAKDLVLPQIVPSANNYVATVRTGNLVYLSGKGPLLSNGKYITGKLGKELNLAEGAEASKLIGLIQLAELKGVLGDLSKVKRIVKVNGFVNSTTDFSGQSGVIDGFSNLMVDIFGEQGKHARTSVGVASLPLNMAVEIELIVEVDQ